MKISVNWLAAAVLAGTLGTAAGQAQRGACSGGEKARQFDFWIGEWKVSSGGKHAGDNVIEPILDGCVLQETWAGSQGSAGSSFNFYDPSIDKWRQFWVWKNGTVLQLQGQFKDGEMILEGESLTRQGQKRLNRVTWTDNPDGTVRQHWEASADGGATWSTVFDGLYSKSEPKPADKPGGNF